ncbi:MAG: transglutaminase TgpA family protein [Methylomicrobium sp.]
MLNKKLQLLLLGTVGLAVLPHYQHLSLLSFGFFSVLLSWRALGIWRPASLPERPIVFLLLLLGLALLFVERQGILGRDAGSNLFITALGLKLMEMKNARDFYLIVYMTFVVAATQFLYEQHILFGAYIGIVCGLLLALLIAMNGLQHNIVQTLKLAGIIILQAAPLAASIFILFPHLDPPKWMAVSSEIQNRTGLSEVMEPGSITNLGLSDELVFRAQFDGPLPPPSLRYWRGPVMSITNGKLWMQTQNFERSPKRNPKISGRPYRYTLLMEPQQKNWVFALDMPVGFSPPLSRNANFQMLTAERPGQRAAYKLTSYPTYNTGPLAPGEYQDSIQLPAMPSARIKELIDRLHGYDAPSTVFIQNLLNHFRHENFRYTLEPPKLDDNPIESFLFDMRAGFCSHYASAFVYLMRAAHIPARVVTGYQGGETNELGNFIQVRQADAHAWAEVWLDNQGWVRYDPTAAVAPERIEYPLDVSRLRPGEKIYFENDLGEFKKVVRLLKEARLIWGTVDYNWQRWIINYNSVHQAKLLSELGIKDSRAMIYWLSAILSAITLLLSTLMLYQKRRKTDPAVRVYQRFCDKLAAKGLVKGTGEGAKDFADRIRIALPQHADEIDRITGIFISLRYGKQPAPQDLKQLKRWVVSFKP